MFVVCVVLCCVAGRLEHSHSLHADQCGCRFGRPHRPVPAHRACAQRRWSCCTVLVPRDWSQHGQQLLGLSSSSGGGTISELMSNLWLVLGGVFMLTTTLVMAAFACMHCARRAQLRRLVHVPFLLLISCDSFLCFLDSLY